jgi:hypothetical protein
MTLYPEKTSGYYPVSIKSGRKCEVNIVKYQPEMNYYLAKTNEGYELVTDITPYVSARNKNCDYCIKKTNLKILK